jgi:hypothetical protein
MPLEVIIDNKMVLDKCNGFLRSIPEIPETLVNAYSERLQPLITDLVMELLSKELEIKPVQQRNRGQNPFDPKNIPLDTEGTSRIQTNKPISREFLDKIKKNQKFTVTT